MDATATAAEISPVEETSASTCEEGSTSILNLIRHLASDTKTLLRQEIELAKAELSEKAAMLTRNSIAIAIGGFIAYAGLIVFLVGVGWLIGWALQKTGLDTMLAEFIGLAIVGLGIMAVGGIFVMKGVRTFSKNTLSPQRTIHSLQHLKGSGERVPTAETKSAPKRPSKEIAVQVNETENRMSETLDTLGYRLSPGRINRQMKRRIRRSPYQSGLLAMAAGMIGGLFLVRGRRSD